MCECEHGSLAPPGRRGQEGRRIVGKSKKAGTPKKKAKKSKVSKTPKAKKKSAPKPAEAAAIPEEEKPTGPAVTRAGVCQSCGVPMDSDDMRGTKADGSKHAEYCVFCFADGAFRKPEMTLEDMIEFVASMLAQKMGTSPEEAKSQVSAFLPQLGRWRQ